MSPQRSESARGGRLKAIEHVRERLIEASPERIWPLLDAVERHREWDERVTRGHSLDSGPDGPMAVGRRERTYQRVAGAEVEADMVVTAHEPYRLIAWRVETWRVGGKPLDLRAARQEFRLRPEGAATRVRMLLAYEPRSSWQRLLSRAGSRLETRQLEHALERLEGLCAERL